MSGAGYPWWTGPATWLAATVLGAVGGTWRIDRVGMDALDARAEAGERFIYAFWHSRILSLAWAHRDRNVAVLISQHRDGELIARTVQRLGYVTPRGSSTRGGATGMREVLEYAERGHLVAVTPDGPRGPKEQVKPGVIQLASRLGWPLIPAGSAAHSEKRLNSWDGFRIPHPFTRVAIGYGEPLHVPQDLSEEDVGAWQERLAAAIGAITSRLQTRVGRPEPNTGGAV